MPAIFNEHSLFLFLGIGFAFGCIALLTVAFVVPWAKWGTQARLHRFTDPSAEPEAEAQASAVLRDRAYSSYRRVDEMLRRYGVTEKLARDLTRARVSLRVGEFLALTAFLAGAGFLLVYSFTGSFLPAIGIGAIGAVAPKLYLNRRQGQRVQAVDDELVDMLALSANSLRSGWGFLQALEQVSAELPPPLSEEARQVLEEVSLGASPEDALMALQQRIPSYDLELIVTAVVIQRKVGGNLAEMLDGIGHTIRERIKLLGEIRALTAEARLSVWVLGALPFALLILMSAMNPGYVDPLLSDPRGRMLLMGIGVMEFVGVLVLRKLSKIVV